jgi:hypothetical protein
MHVWRKHFISVRLLKINLVLTCQEVGSNQKSSTIVVVVCVCVCVCVIQFAAQGAGAQRARSRSFVQ